MNQLPTGFKDFLLHRDMKRFINFVRRWHNLHLLQPLRHLNILFFIHHPPMECCKDYLLIFRLQQNKLRWRRWQNIIEICLIKIYLCVQTSKKVSIIQFHIKPLRDHDGHPIQLLFLSHFPRFLHSIYIEYKSITFNRECWRRWR